MDQRNLLLAIVIAMVILIGSQMMLDRLYPPPPPRDDTAEMAPDGDHIPSPDASMVPAVPGAVPSPEVGEIRREAVERAPRIQIESPKITGSISLRGGRIDDVTLRNYRVSVEPHSDQVVLLSPADGPGAYYGEFGWVRAGGADVEMPDANTLWETSDSLLVPGQPVTLTWTNEDGLEFRREIALDDGYMFTITQQVRNTGSTAVTLLPYALVSRSGTPPTSGFFILHEGPIGVLDGTLREPSYGDLRDGRIEHETVGGWIGITDKYWLAALVPDQATPSQTRFLHSLRNGQDRYQADFLGQPQQLGPRMTIEASNMFFAGAKEVRLLDHYRDTYGIDKFDRAVDFGWFYFLTKPIFYALEWLYGLLGNFGLAILALTVVIKLIFFPLANKSYRAMSQMKKLQPEMMKLRERYGDDKQKMNQELMALYRKEKVNPAAGCLPIVIQIPVFFALYKVLFVTIEMRHAPFFGWIQDLSAKDPLNLFELYGLIPWGAPGWLHLGLWPLIMGATMWFQMRLNPTPADPIQAKVFMFMPIIFTVILAGFPAGLVIYWAWNNLLSIIQQWVIMRRMGVQPAFLGGGGTVTAGAPAAGGAAKAGGNGKADGGGKPWWGKKQTEQADAPPPGAEAEPAAAHAEADAAAEGEQPAAASKPQSKPTSKPRSKPKPKAPKAKAKPRK